MDRYKGLIRLGQPFPDEPEVYKSVCACVCVCVCVCGGGGGGAGYHFILLNFVKSKLAKMVRRSDFHCSFSLLVLTVIRFLFAD